MKFSTLLLTAFLLCGAVATAQTVTPTVVASAGGTNTAAGITISWTVGEIAVTTLRADDLYVTQGFHQPPLGTTSVPNGSSAILLLETAPNPVVDLLNVTLPESNGSGSFVLVDLLGRTVLERNPTAGESALGLDISGLPAGTYVAQYMADGSIWAQVITVRR